MYSLETPDGTTVQMYCNPWSKADFGCVPPSKEGPNDPNVWPTLWQIGTLVLTSPIIKYAYREGVLLDSSSRLAWTLATSPAYLLSPWSSCRRRLNASS